MPSRRGPTTPDEAFADFQKRLHDHGALTVPWPKATPLVRCHSNRWGPADFYADGFARFSPFDAPAARSRRTPSGTAVPVLYAADSEVGALSETVFRDLPIKGRKVIARAQLRRRNLSRLVLTRDLKLADLTSHGLARLRLTRKSIVESPSTAYWRTTQLARAIFESPEDFDGLLWVSRQHDTSRAVVLFGGRVDASDIDTDPSVPTFPLDFGHGRDLVDEIADRVDITIVDP